MKWVKESLIANQKISLHDVLNFDGKKYDLLFQLENTEQDAEWHSEGNVFVHTQMVIDETYNIFEKNLFSLEEKYILLMAAIFHDIAKPIVTKKKFLESRGRECVIAPKHEEEGMSYLFYKFLEEEMTNFEMNSILELVGYHQIPKLLVIKNENEWKYKNLTRNVSGKLFYYLELADMLGRTSIDKDYQINILSEFKMFCEEYNCFNSPSNINKEVENIFISNFNEKGKSLDYITNKALYDLVNGYIEEPIVAYQKYYEKKDNFPVLYVLCGISGSGKSTAIEMLKDEKSIIISLDEIRKNYKQNNSNRREIEGKVKQEAKFQLKKALNENATIFYDATNLRKDFRKIVCDLGQDYKAQVCLLFVQEKISECIKSDKIRTSRTIGEDVIENQVKMFQFPEDSEFEKVFYFKRTSKSLLLKNFSIKEKQSNTRKLKC